jgi:sugar lactone lactonase YvrE
MKTPLVALFAVVTAAALSAQTPSLVKLWQTDATLKVPESVLHDAGRGVLYVTNIDGEPWGEDGKGSIGKIGLDGKVIAVDWVTGLSAPKGMGLHGKRLYVADMDRVVVIDVEQGAIVEKIPVAGSHGLNDVAVSPQGVVYISDSKDKKIYALDHGKATVVVEGLKAPNGVHVHDGALYFMDNGSIFRLGAAGEKIPVNTGMEGNGDGLEAVGGGAFVVSYWQGVIHYCAADGTRTTLLDSSADKVSAADVGYNTKNRILYVPTFFKNTVVAYQLK